MIGYNKITKDRYLPTARNITQSAQLYDISGEKMKYFSIFPQLVNPHYAESAAGKYADGKTEKNI
jgi:nitrous-oxide reductase